MSHVQRQSLNFVFQFLYPIEIWNILQAITSPHLLATLKTNIYLYILIFLNYCFTSRISKLCPQQHSWDNSSFYIMNVLCSVHRSNTSLAEINIESIWQPSPLALPEYTQEETLNQFQILPKVQMSQYTLAHLHLDSETVAVKVWAGSLPGTSDISSFRLLK